MYCTGKVVCMENIIKIVIVAVLTAVASALSKDDK